MLYCNIENENKKISIDRIRQVVLAGIESAGANRSLLIIPPDITRVHSGAGIISRIIWEEYRDKVKDILPATGTHITMTGNEINSMFGDIPHDLFRVHNCRKDIINLGKISASYINEVSGGALNYEWPVQVNKLLSNHTGSLIISVGQVVPHEVTGMANYNKNIFIGCGGYESINKSHYLSAVYGIEKLMGKAMNPVRDIINLGEKLYAQNLDILYILTVIGAGADRNPSIKGLYIGSDIECFLKASELSARINITTLERPPEKIVVYLNPTEYRSTWLGNKAIYRTRMALKDKGELIIIAPGVQKFGEDPEIDRLIKKYGYRSSSEILELVNRNKDLQDNLGVAAHIIHSSPDGRFSVTYCTHKNIEDDIRKARFDFLNIEDALQKYDIKKLKNGYNTLADGEEIYYISNPGLGLWQLNT
ncbi:MAG TPA: D-mannonate epimerase [Bacteroidales bacterium]|nr:D-mannonate epimerase [Bacteroidales bacterium]